MRSRFLFSVAAVSTLVTAAHAQWTVTNLHPTGAQHSWTYAASGNQQVGHAQLPGGPAGVRNTAVLWSGTAASWVDLHPSALGSGNSIARGAGGNQQVGVASGNGFSQHASLWRGTAASWVDLNPPQSFVGSEAFACRGDQQVGYAYVQVVGGFQKVHAGLWRGTALSWVDLNPSVADTSAAVATNGIQQAGYVYLLGQKHASLWSGTAASWVDLNPGGAGSSWCNGISGDQQVGVANGHASLWRGTSSSWVDLGNGEAYATDGNQQAGYVYLLGHEHASLWSGTAASRIDLSAFLPVGFSSSRALGLSNDGVNLYVCGYGRNELTGRTEALLWRGPLPPPVCPADFNNDGTVDFFDYDSFVDCFEGGTCPPGKTADFDGDGSVDFFDYDAFVVAFEAGC